MTKPKNHVLDAAAFNDIKTVLTERLQNVIEAKLIEMGDSAKGISWFSSTAQNVAIGNQ